jgi:hypothetical protein
VCLYLLTDSISITHRKKYKLLIRMWRVFYELTETMILIHMSFDSISYARWLWSFRSPKQFHTLLPEAGMCPFPSTFFTASLQSPAQCSPHTLFVWLLPYFLQKWDPQSFYFVRADPQILSKGEGRRNFLTMNVEGSVLYSYVIAMKIHLDYCEDNILEVELFFKFTYRLVLF